MKRPARRSWVIAACRAGVGSILGGCAAAPVSAGGSATPPCSVEGTPEEPGCLVFKEEPVNILMSIVFVRVSAGGQSVESAFFADSAISCPDNHGRQSLASYSDPDEAADRKCEAARQLGLDFHVYSTTMGAQDLQWSIWSPSLEGWTAHRADSAEELTGTVSPVVNRQECILEDLYSDSSSYERESRELTDGTVTLADLTPDGAVLDFDFDGARGRIASRVCTMNDGLW